MTKMVQKDVFINILKFINVGNLKKNTHCTLYVLCILVSFMFSYYYNFVRGWRKCDAFSSIFETCYLYKGLLKGKNSDVVVFFQWRICTCTKAVTTQRKQATEINKPLITWWQVKKFWSRTFVLSPKMREALRIPPSPFEILVNSLS